ncbi:MAG: hypothetical protein ACI379_00635 [Nocardioides sp.]|uniref:hypothetical protein n=1 Tax=Nocardioides sp. TaxID=35761 RepID=UPI003F125CE8
MRSARPLSMLLTSVVAASAWLVAAPAPASAPAPRAMGSTLVADPGTWAPSDVTLEYQWLNVLGVEIPGATEREFTIGPDTPVLASFPHEFSVRVTGRRAGAQAVDAESAPVRGTIDPADGADIDGATSAALELAEAHEGKRISVRVTGSLSGYATVSRTSDRTAQVAAEPVEVVAGTVTVSGTARAGHTLTADPGTWTPAGTVLTYQWLRNGTVIKGATKATYKLGAKDRGKRISVRVTGTRTYFATVRVTSARTAKVTR